ncbi:glycosyltransferase family 4 protein [Teichococcus aestuarii]|uniref:Group 1 glycosyl transferase n=1 Tax=Teichococcus aestuarii TaxID=568898 RepID=A0A2U1UY87_9PROT|nr:glycosyltransferase family 4 protein [Pseudoroseomonas aestuarii]PWC26571.1 group 1 glycosyl transferase [Pseudoroseomonas aestuarii]
MRILLACASFPPQGRGGGPIGSQMLAKALVKAGHEVHVVTVADQASRTESDGLTVETVPSLNVYWNYYKPNPAWKKLLWHAIENFNPRSFLRLGELIEEIAPDILMTVSVENINVATWLAARQRGIPCIHVAQSYFLMCWRGSLFNASGNCSQCLGCKAVSVGKKAMSQNVDALITETEFLRDAHLEKGYFRHARTYVIPGAIEGSGTRRQRQAGRLRVGYIGTHTPNKGIEVLAAAARRLEGRGDISFAIAGRGEEVYTAMLRTAFPASSTSFLGWMASKDFFGEIDVVVVPSLWREPFGRVSVEGTIFNVPAIVSRIGGLAENVKDGVTGLSIEPGDDAALASHLERLADDKRFYEHLAENARKSSAVYSIEAVSKQLDSCIQEVFQGRRRGDVAKASCSVERLMRLRRGASGCG